jgi:hypothetical protein
VIAEMRDELESEFPGVFHKKFSFQVSSFKVKIRESHGSKAGLRGNPKLEN